MVETDAHKWDSIYHTQSGGPIESSQVLRDYEHLLPKSGKALDLACGRGGNALFLAKQGFETHAWDISETVLQQLQQASNNGKPIQTRVFDTEHQTMPLDAFDVIVVSRFLQRNLFPSLIDALRPGGLLFYQTFVNDKVDAIGPKRPDYLLQPNELLRHFQGLHILAYREEGTQGDKKLGFRNEAMIVAQKPLALV